MRPLSDASLRFGEALTQTTLGLDALYRTELGSTTSIDGLAVLNMGYTTSDSFADYADARRRLRELAVMALELPEPDRRLYYSQAVMSLDSFAAWRQGEMPFMAQIGMFLHCDPSPATQADIEGYHAELRSLLNGLGYVGDLREQMAKWEERHRVPADSVKQVMDEMLEEGYQKALQMFPMPEGDRYGCAVETGAPYNARSDYPNRLVWINTDPVLTRPGLKHLVCHECYPGHFVQFSLRRIYYEQGLAAADGLLSVVNHSSSSTFEGIADTGIHFMDWVENDDDRVALTLAEMRGALGTISSFQMHVLKRPQDEVRDWLRHNALAGGEGWVANRIRFLSAPSRSALIWSYWRGDKAVGSVWQRVDPERKQDFLDYGYGRLHSPQSLALFV